MGLLQGIGRALGIGQGQARQRSPVPAQRAWVMEVEGWFFHLISLGFSGASAYAIWQIFVSHHAGDIGRSIEGGVVAFCFGIAGYFLSRNIAYRMMQGEMIWWYIPVCLVVELVEIYCNYIVGVSALHLEDFLQDIPADQHGWLMAIGRVVVSSIPAMTLFLAVAHMDLERKKMQAGGQPKQPHANNYTTSYQSGYQSSYQSQGGNTQNGANPRRGVRSGGTPPGP